MRLFVADERPGRARHLVQLRAVAALDSRLARRDRGPELLLPRQRSGDGPRHPVLLGRPHDNDGPQEHLGDTLRHRVPAWPDTRPRGRQDEQVQGQRDGPAGADRPVRRRRAPVRADERQLARKRHAPQRAEDGGQPQLRQQAVERVTLRDRQHRPRGRRVGLAVAAVAGARRGPVDSQPAQSRSGPGADPHGGVPVRRGAARRPRLPLGRVLRLVPRDGQDTHP